MTYFCFRSSLRVFSQNYKCNFKYKPNDATWKMYRRRHNVLHRRKHMWMSNTEIVTFSMHNYIKMNLPCWLNPISNQVEGLSCEIKGHVVLQLFFWIVFCFRSVKTATNISLAFSDFAPLLLSEWKELRYAPWLNRPSIKLKSNKLWPTR